MLAPSVPGESVSRAEKKKKNYEVSVTFATCLEASVEEAQEQA